MNFGRITSVVYEKVFRKTSTFVVFIGVSAVFADRMLDGIADTLFAKINEGRLWKDVKKQLKLNN